MPKNHPNRSKKGGKGGGSTAQTAPTALQNGPAFAESIPDAGWLGQEMAVRGMLLSMSDLQGLPNPDPILRAEGKSLATYRQMVDGHLSSVMGKRFAAVRSRPWIIERGKATSRATAKLQSIFDALDVRTMTYNTLAATGMGVSMQEVVWGTDEWYVPVKVVDRPQEWFQLGLRGESRFLGDDGRTEIMPPHKLLIARHRPDYLNPYGRPILSECFWPLAFKRGGLKFWMYFAEKFGFPKTIGKVPASMSKGDKLDLLVRLEAMVRAAAAVIPEGTSVELLQTKVSGDLPFPDLVRWADSEMSKAWLGETLSTELQGQGSRAAAQVHNEVRADLALDDANMVESTMNELIRWIWEVNSVTGPMPWFEIQMPEDLKTGRLARDAGLYRLGMRFNDQYFQNTYDIAPEHIARIDEGRAGVGSDSGAAFAAAEDDEPPRSEEILQALLEQLPDGALGAQGEELSQVVLDMAARSSGYEEFLELLDSSMGGLRSGEFEDVLERFCVLSELAGATDAAAAASDKLDADA